MTPEQTRAYERDACGIGFVADVNGVSSRVIVEAALEALRSMRHRGAVSADSRTGDGAGVLVPAPHKLLRAEGYPEGCGMGMVFIDPADPGPGKAVVERSLAAEGLTLRAWRTVPVDESSLGEDACTTAPLILQALFTGPQAGSDAGERRAFRARRRLEQTAHLERLGLHVSSLSFRTVVYKALCAADQLDGFYLDLAEPSFEGWFALFHQRFSTNTTPSWERAQPFRTLAHNGEINTIRGNQAMMFARAGRLGAGSLAPEGLLSPCWRHRARIPECSIRPSS